MVLFYSCLSYIIDVIMGRQLDRLMPFWQPANILHSVLIFMLLWQINIVVYSVLIGSFTTHKHSANVGKLDVCGYRCGEQVFDVSRRSM